MKTIMNAMYSIRVADRWTQSMMAPSTANWTVPQESISSYNTTGTPVKAAGGAINALMKLFCDNSTSIGMTGEGAIYVETNLHDGPEKLLALLDVDSQSLQVGIYNPSSGNIRAFDESRTPYELCVTHFVYQRAIDAPGVSSSWEKLVAHLSSSPVLVSPFDEPVRIQAGQILDSQYFGSSKEFAISEDQVEELRYLPTDITDLTEMYLQREPTWESITLDSPFEETTEESKENEPQLTTLEQMQALQERVFPLVKEFFNALSDEDKALIPTDEDVRNYIPTTTFKNIISIVEDGLTEHNLSSQNILLKGAPGTGKSKMGVALAYVFQMPYRYTQGYKTMDASEYRGTTIANNGVLHTSTDTPFVATAARGGLFVDEDNNYSNEGENTVKNSMLIEPYSMVLADQTTVKRHPFSIFMMTANPDMKGARPINEAYKDRHCIIVDLEPLNDKEMIQMVSSQSKLEDTDVIRRMIECWRLINDKIANEGEDADLLTPRTLIYWARQTRILGNPVEAARYNLLGALCCSPEFAKDVLQTVIVPRFKATSRKKSSTAKTPTKKPTK